MSTRRPAPEPLRLPRDVTTNCESASDFGLVASDWQWDLVARSGPAHQSPEHAERTVLAIAACLSCPGLTPCRRYAEQLIVSNSADIPQVLGGLYVMPGGRHREPLILKEARRSVSMKRFSAGTRQQDRAS